MTNWFVSSHGNVEHKNSRQYASLVKSAVASTVNVPAGMELVFFCPPDRQLAMTAGWKLWDMLMYGEKGGEDAAYAAKYISYGEHKSVTNYYSYIDWSDFNDWADGPNRGNSHPTQNTYGVWEIGDATAPKIDLNTKPDMTVRLAEVLSSAKTAGAKRVYWGCCRAHVMDDMSNTESSDKIFVPQKLR